MEIENFKFIKKREMEDIFEEIKEANDETIEKFDKIYPLAFIINKEKLTLFDLTGNLKEKRRNLFKIISQEKLEGYIIVSEERNEDDFFCISRTLYTPKKIIKNIVFIKNNKKLKEKNLFGRESIIKDFFDIWGDFNIYKGFKLKSKL